MDEVTEFFFRNNVNLAFISETWLKDVVSDGVVHIPGYAVVRKDRKTIDHGGVCAYIRQEYCKYKHLSDLNCCEDHETLWLYLRRNRLPRGFSCIHVPTRTLVPIAHFSGSTLPELWSLGNRRFQSLKHQWLVKPLPAKTDCESTDEEESNHRPNIDQHVLVL
ncbi:predicted protein [Nematostella vectensis]|uniref:Uncharacterized protein n=1 Tax=Nematostella vectensis TaxID=45351 RepID=A7SZ72_NEMVE|nr:predicted protein [Nematostella vectensis]|eukprot:XP_001623099.1 predicted protein [Nematostella vectensis]